MAVTASEGLIGSHHVIPALIKQCIDARVSVGFVAGMSFEAGFRRTIGSYEQHRDEPSP